MRSFLNSLTPKQIHGSGVSLSILMIGLCVYLVHSSWKSRQTGIESTQHELTQVTTQLSDAQIQRGRLVNQISDLQSMVDEQHHAQRAMSLNELAILIVALAEEHQLRLEQFDPAQRTSIEGDSVVPITLRLSAPYASLTDWLDEIHETMSDIHVVGILITSQSSTTTVIGADIRLHWYIPTKPNAAP